jgi:hypothetical protein
LTAPEIDIKTAKIGKKFLRSNQLRKLAKTATGFNYVKKNHQFVINKSVFNVP